MLKEDICKTIIDMISEYFGRPMRKMYACKLIYSKKPHFQGPHVCYKNLERATLEFRDMSRVDTDALSYQLYVPLTTMGTRVARTFIYCEQKVKDTRVKLILMEKLIQ